MMKYYRLDAVDRLISRYIDRGGSMDTVQEGVLGYGKVILSAEGCKTAVITERFLNSQASTHTVRFYNETPKKYLAYV